MYNFEYLCANNILEKKKMVIAYSVTKYLFVDKDLWNIVKIKNFQNNNSICFEYI